MPLAQKVTIVTGGGGGISGGVTAATGAMAVASVLYDSQLVSTPAAGIRAIVTFPATPGKSWVITELSFSLINDTGAVWAAGSFSGRIRILDPAMGELWAQLIGVLGVAGSTYGRDLVGIAYKGSVNTTLIVDFQFAPSAGMYQSITAAAYLI